MTKRAQLHHRIHDALFAVYGVCGCPLIHATPFQLLVAVRLSAQCKDERVNKVTEKLFALAPDPEKMAALPAATVEEIVHPCGLGKTKSSDLQNMARMLLEQYHGEVPRTMEELVRLPGVGRKSANVILGNCFDIPGFPVDTHVKRLLYRIGATASDSPEKIEQEVNADMEPEYWTNYSHILIQHGRRVCHARGPECEACVLNSFCRKRK